MTDVPKVYACIAKVSAEIAQTGVSKTRKNVQQGYSFRGIDDIYNALAGPMAKHGLIIVPNIISRECVERVSKSGTLQFFVIVQAEFAFIAAEDGSMVSARTYGEAQDSADKATNKAMSAAYKYAAFQTFCIPTEGDNDADATTPEPVKAAEQPAGFPETVKLLTMAAEKGTAELQAEWRRAPQDLRAHIQQEELAWWEALKAAAAKVKEPAHA